jgi:ubiquitin-protein ligase|tara:strand:- start:734 stop:1453 length:720 start_codon:yes stop_codon:yes gene_type:complete
MSENNQSVVVSRDTVKRLINDIKDIRKSPLDSEGIYYKHDDTNLLLGYAYICGPKDSMYFGGNYFYKIDFPYDYPHRPPKMTFMNKDGKTRFHPNMYKKGKICLSILNTWKGDQWTGCQSIRSILLTIVSILDNNPLLHEPGFTEAHIDCKRYNKIIQYKNVDFSINNIMLNKVTDIVFYTDLFKDEIYSQFNKNKENLMQLLDSMKDTKNENVITGIYGLNEDINWTRICSDFNSIKI